MIRILLIMPLMAYIGASIALYQFHKDYALITMPRGDIPMKSVEHHKGQRK